MSGGSLYAATWIETIGRWLGSGSGKRRLSLVRQSMSQLSKVKEVESASATTSNSSSTPDARRASKLNPAPNVVSTLNTR